MKDIALTKKLISLLPYIVRPCISWLASIHASVRPASQQQGREALGSGCELLRQPPIGGAEAFDFFRDGARKFIFLSAGRAVALFRWRARPNARHARPLARNAIGFSCTSSVATRNTLASELQT